MPQALVSAKIEKDGRVRVLHIFLAPNEKEAEELQKKHARGCTAYGPALATDKTIDVVFDVDELPEADEDSIEEFMEMFSAGPEDQDEEEEEGEEGEEEEEPEAEEA